MKTTTEKPKYVRLNGQFCTLSELAIILGKNFRTVSYWAAGTQGKKIKTTVLGKCFHIVEKSEVRRIIAEVENE